VYRTCPLGDWTHKVDLIHFLKSAAIPETQWCRTANDEYRAVRKISIGDACDAIGDARSCRQKRHARLPCTFAPAFGSMDCCLFVSCIYHANSFASTPIIDRGNMTSAERENDFNAFFLQDLRDQPTSMY
jgi:hypothetical protein